MDPLGSINAKKDSTVAMLQAAEARGWDLFVCEPSDLAWQGNEAIAAVQALRLANNSSAPWYSVSEHQTTALSIFSVILMRKDPPFDMEYIYSTYLLEHAQAAGVLVSNDPQSLRDVNEKFSITHFPQCCVETLISADISRLKAFHQQYSDVIYKPLDGMGGMSVFRIRDTDPNLSVVLDTLTNNGSRHIMAQRFIADITKGDKRILMINGEPSPYALARIPQGADGRGNLALGARAEGLQLTAREQWICEQLRPTLQAKGLHFVGIDVIGDYLTEINVTSPTGIRELDRFFNSTIAADYIDYLASQLES